MKPRYSMVMFDEQNRIVFRAGNVTESVITTEPDEYYQYPDYWRVLQRPGYTTLKLKLEGDDNGTRYESFAYDV